jgi:hypothetical protein
MTLIVVERAFDAARSFEEVQDKERGAAWCFEKQRVRRVRALFARDGLRMIGMYEAPDMEAMRTTQRTAGLPIERAWAATPIVDAVAEPATGHVLAIVQRTVPSAITLEQIRHLTTDPTGCGRRLGVAHVGAFVSLDLSRMICVFHAPDLESVRVGNRQMGLPADAVWSSELLGAPA